MDVAPIGAAADGVVNAAGQPECPYNPDRSLGALLLSLGLAGMHDNTATSPLPFLIVFDSGGSAKNKWKNDLFRLFQESRDAGCPLVLPLGSAGCRLATTLQGLESWLQCRQVARRKASMGRSRGFNARLNIESNLDHLELTMDQY